MLADAASGKRTRRIVAYHPVGAAAIGRGPPMTPSIGHEGSFASDGLTYYGGGRVVPNNYYGVDVSDPARPKLMGAWNVPRVANGVRTHRLPPMRVPLTCRKVAFPRKGTLGYTAPKLARVAAARGATLRKVAVSAGSYCPSSNEG